MSKAVKVAVLVAGSWGTAIASVLAENGREVLLWSRSPQQVEEINTEHRNHRFLGEARLSERIRATASMKEAVEGAAAVFVVAPSSAMREIAVQLKPLLTESMTLVHATKGFETGSLKRMSEVLADELPQLNPGRIVVLSGPSHAEEVIQRCPTTVVVASAVREAAVHAQELLTNSYFRVYTTPDVVGVEVGGALKNIIAICAGLSDGLGFGDNAKAALLTRGLAEIGRLGTAMGANPLTFAGLAGLGDLVVTATSKHSRNWRAGAMLAEGLSLDEVLSRMGMVVEGVKTTQAAQQLAARYQIEMPITDELYQMLFDGKAPKNAVVDLMGREPTHESVQVAKSTEAGWS